MKHFTHTLCYGHVRLCVIHNSFSLYGGMPFVLVMLRRRLNISEPEHWVTWSHRTGIKFQLYIVVTNVLHVIILSSLNVKQKYFLCHWNKIYNSLKHLIIAVTTICVESCFKPDHQIKIFVLHLVWLIIYTG